MKLKREAMYSQAADVWSIDAIFFYLLTGEPLLDLDGLRSETAEFQRMVKAVVGGVSAICARPPPRCATAPFSKQAQAGAAAGASRRMRSA